MIINGLEGREAEEAHALANCHAHCLEGDASAESVQEESLKRMVVQSAVSIRNVQTVVAGVESGCFVLVNHAT